MKLYSRIEYSRTVNKMWIKFEHKQKFIYWDQQNLKKIKE